jgi:hypothetical protein
MSMIFWHSPTLSAAAQPAVPDVLLNLDFEYRRQTARDREAER